MRHLLLAAVGFTSACFAGPQQGPLAPSLNGPSCEDGETYPDGYDSDPTAMELGGVLYPHQWPVGTHRGTGTSAAVDLSAIPCDASAEIDWSPFDVLLFVSIPAW